MRIIYLKTYYVWLKTLELKCVLYVKHMGNYVLHIIIPHTESTKSPQKYISIGQYLLPFNVSLYILLYIGMPIPLQEMIPGESGDRGMVNCHSPGKGEFSAYSSGFGSGNRGNKNTKYRHSFESLVHNQHYTLEILGFHYM